jgi:flagellar motor protein MotB
MSGEDDHSVFEDEGAGYLVSVSDMMSGLLFVFIITLVAFVIQFQYASEDAVEEKEELIVQQEKTEQERETLASKVEYLTNTRKIRRHLLSEIQQKLYIEGVNVTVDLEHGVLRLTEEAVRFSSGTADIEPGPQKNLKLIARVLADLLPCFAKIEEMETDCPQFSQGKLEAIFVEGHTDNVPINNGTYKSNWELSAQRAINTYQFMQEAQPALVALKNANDEPLFSVAGYAARRPLIAHKTATNDPLNRRIDLRFIMMPPREDPDIIKAIRQQGVN